MSAGNARGLARRPEDGDVSREKKGIGGERERENRESLDTIQSVAQ